MANKVAYDKVEIGLRPYELAPFVTGVRCVVSDVPCVLNCVCRVCCVCDGVMCVM
jgi:hypothetical protein